MAEGSVPIGGIVGGILSAVIVITMVVVISIWFKRKISQQVCVGLVSHSYLFSFLPIDNTKCLSIDIGTKTLLPCTKDRRVQYHVAYGIVGNATIIDTKSVNAGSCMVKNIKLINVEQ